MEWATQQPEDTIELRIYRGKDASFTMYEDENDTYNYEKGKYVIFNFNWNDESKTLNISSTKGSFDGMLKKRVFNVIIVDETKGITEAISSKIDKSIVYSGKDISVKLR